MLPKISFALGTRVYLKLNAEDAGIITGIIIRVNGVLYFVSWGDRSETTHYEMELQTEKEFKTS